MQFLGALVVYRLMNHRRNEERGAKDIVTEFDKHLEHWLEHVERIDPNRPPKLLLEYHSKGRRNPGSPCERWTDQS